MGDMQGSARRGVYGLGIDGLGTARHLMPVADDSWPTLTVTTEVGGRTLEQNSVTEEQARYRIETVDGEVRLDRANRTARFTMARVHDDQDFLHPFLALTGSVFAWWGGREGFHAGAFVRRGRAWGVLGEQGAGKSSVLAQLHLAGTRVLTDDLLVVDDGVALPGPSCIDLREGAAEHLGVGEHLGRVGARVRYRLTLPPTASPVRLAGWVVPGWNEGRSTVSRVPAVQRLALLGRHLSLYQTPTSAQRFLELAALPVLAWHRPQRWVAADDALAVLLDATD